MTSRSYTLYYVLNGLLNGERDVSATRSGSGLPQPDGHYFLPDDGATDGEGPYDSVDEARSAAEDWRTELEPQYWVFPLSLREEGPPRRMTPEEEVTGCDTDGNVVSVRRVPVEDQSSVRSTTAWRLEAEGSYEVLTLEMTGTLAAAIEVFGVTLEAAAKYQT